jgi:UDP-3-O-[3-hydroxymyristoyl] glucosamine N-acyltransferase
MKLPRTYSLKEISELVNCEYVGNADHPITGINEIHMVEEGDIVFVDHPKYYDKALNSAATTIIINKSVEPPPGKGLILSDKPFNVFNELTLHFSQKQKWENNKPPKVASSAKIAPGVVLGNNVEIGEDCIIHPNVVIYDNVKLGDRVEIHANSVLGGHAFYYKKEGDVYTKMHSCGSIQIEDDVEIGCSCTIDKGVSGATHIGKGTKIDNSVHVGHDTYIGKNCLIAAQVGIAGCVVVDDGATLWGQVGIRSDVRIGKGTVILAQSGITKSLKDNTTYFGSPADESREKLKELAYLRKIPGLIEELKSLKKNLNED